MTKPKFIYSSHARWYVSIAKARTSGELRFALVVSSVHHGHLVGALAEELTPMERTHECAELVARLLRNESWFHLPREIRCREPDLTKRLRHLVGRELDVRTDANARCFQTIDLELARHLETAALQR